MEIESTLPSTAWESGRLDARGGSSKLLFGRMHEDARVELSVFRPGQRLFCIASAGCTAIKLAMDHEVVAVDINPVQIGYVQRRLAGAPVLRGSAEHMMAFLRALAPVVGWKREFVEYFVDLEDVDEQIDYWHRHLNTRRFRFGLDAFLSRATLRALYSAPLVDCLPANFGRVLRARMERIFSLHPNRQNSFARMLLLGEMPSRITAESAISITLCCADAAQFIERQPRGSFDGFSLSNILDGANRAYERRLLAAVKHAAAPGALVVRRSFREPSVLEPTNRAADDRSMLWGVVDVRTAEAV